VATGVPGVLVTREAEETRRGSNADR
jgi:hypothetical protein